MKSKKQVLGRGLTSLLGQDVEEDNTVSSDSIIKLPIEKIKPGPWQARKRFSESDIKDLANSIQQKGVINPIIVSKKNSDETYFIIAGERRWRACQIAKVHNIPSIIYQNIENNLASEISLIENIQRDDLSIVEEAIGYKKLINDFNYTQETVAKKLGKSRSQITNILRLLKLPKKVIELLDDKKISYGHARALIDNPLAVDLSYKIIKNNLSVRETENLISNISANKKKTKKTKKNTKNENFENLEDIENEISNLLGLKVLIKYDNLNKSSKITVNCHSDEQLNYILNKLGLKT